MSKDVFYRIFTILLGITFPLIMISVFPGTKSLSSFWNTSMVPLFILMNIVTASFFFTLDNWRLPAILLVLTTAFPYTYYNSIHNILATMFFLTSSYAMIISNRYNWLTILLIPAVLMSFINVFWAEVIAIDTISLFHGLVLWKREKINKQRIKNKNI